MSSFFLILPNTLYNPSFLSKNFKYIIYEHPDFFTKYKFNKKKLILHRSSMKYYYDLLKQNKFEVQYLNFNDELPKQEYTYYDPINKNIDIDGTKLESPNFLVTTELMEKYRKKTDKFLFNNFYLWSKKELNIYPQLKSMDKFNRQRFKMDLKIPKLYKLMESEHKYIEMAKKYVNEYFSTNYGNVDNFFYPISHESAKQCLTYFLDHKFKNFGKFQDFINKENMFMFHSMMASSMNIGLINTPDIIHELKNYEDTIAVNDFEGFLRQLFWREYQRYCYQYIDFTQYNYFNHTVQLDNRWYEGNLKIKPVDDLIKSGFDTGYIHHIGRLMIIGNFMMLNNVSPQQGFQWFMEFSCDSYEWVMYQNVYDMVFFVTGGKTMRKPYVSSSNYVLKMSNYKKDKWCDTWDALYYQFVDDHKEKLYKFRYHFPSLNKILSKRKEVEASSSKVVKKAK